MGVQLGDLRPFLDKMIALLKTIDRNTNVSGCCSTTNSSGQNTSVPAGFSSVSIVALSGTVDVTMADGSIYPLTTTGETLVQTASPNKSLPAYHISGGTWKWIALK
jgi:hypothetical protein